MGTSVGFEVEGAGFKDTWQCREQCGEPHAILSALTVTSL